MSDGQRMASETAERRSWQVVRASSPKMHQSPGSSAPLHRTFEKFCIEPLAEAFHTCGYWTIFVESGWVFGESTPRCQITVRTTIPDWRKPKQTFLHKQYFYDIIRFHEYSQTPRMFRTRQVFIRKETVPQASFAPFVEIRVLTVSRHHQDQISTPVYPELSPNYHEIGNRWDHCHWYFPYPNCPFQNSSV